MILSELKKHIFNNLISKFNPQEISIISSKLIEKVTGLSVIQQHNSLDKKIGLAEVGTIQLKVNQIIDDKPLEYVIEEAEFFGLKFFVDKNVLIPRPETEELVEWILNVSKGQHYRLLDIGTGSGCISITLAVISESYKITAIDVSEKALEVAKRNAIANSCSVRFSQHDILKTKIEEEYDIIVSNPPYVLDSEKRLMRNNVLDFEPESALFVTDENPLLFYRKIAEEAQISLISGGSLFFEINEKFGEDCCIMLENMGFFNVILRKDLNGKDRMIKAMKK